MTEAITITIPGAAIDELATRIAACLTPTPTSASPSLAYLTTAEAADYLRCRPQRIYDLVSARKLPVLKEGSRSLFRREHLDALVTEQD